MMAKVKHCEMPNCSRPQLVGLKHESSSTVTKHYCPSCGRIYSIPTFIGGRLVPLAPLGTLGLIAWSIFQGDVEEAIEHGGNAIEHFLG